ncbi:hypothetical protein ACLOAV_004816 [Pseudogymnoascus australis]
MLPQRGSFEYDITILDLQSSVANETCSWCSLILEYVQDLISEISLAISKGYIDVDDEYGLSASDIDKVKGGGPLHLIVAARDWKGALSFTEKIIEIWAGSWEHSRHFSSLTSPEDEAAKYITGREPLYDFKSPESFAQVRSWLENCDHEHETCSRPNLSFCPMRLIDVRPDGGDSARVILLDNRGNNLKAKYAALSYCWGGEANFKVTADSIRSYEEGGIQIEDLPQTVQDAIICTRELGFQYLWVDTLCIIQDSASDKREQIAQMRKIFHNAAITIVAGSARTVYDGFLAASPPPQQSGLLPYYASSEKSGTFRLIRTKFHQYSEVPVNLRAWTLEEALLSQRLLIYSSSSLQWQCQAGNDIACQGAGSHIIFGPRDAHYRLPNPIFLDASAKDGPPKDADARFVIDVDTSMYSPTRWSDPIKAVSNANDSWAACLRLYTSRELTRPNDKLQAISGLAEQFSLFFAARTSIEQGERYYLSGLWSHQMPHALCWKRDLETALLPRPKEYRAPSWSWASVDGMVHAGGITEVFEFETTGIDVALLHADHPFGRVREGCQIHVRGLLIELEWDPELRTLVFPGDLPVSNNPATGYAIFPDAAEEVSSQVFCVPVQCNYSGRTMVDGKIVDIPTAGWKYNGLVLMKVPGRRQHYKRVACFQGFNQDRFSMLWDGVIATEFTLV